MPTPDEVATLAPANATGMPAGTNGSTPAKENQRGERSVNATRAGDLVYFVGRSCGTSGTGSNCCLEVDDTGGICVTLGVCKTDSKCGPKSD